MTVEEYLRAPFNDLSINLNTIRAAALSPAKLKLDRFRAVGVDEVYEDNMADDVFADSVEYALSTLYYSMSATVTGGSKSEKRGNRQISIGGYALTTRDREAFRKRANDIRTALGLDVDDEYADTGGMFDATNLRRRP